MGSTEKTYEMLWDCKYCGQGKLLGLSHRHCPKCGAPQDATKRYFPPDDEKIAVEDHPFVGADVQCRACGAWNSRAAAHCTGCGGPLAGGRDAPVVGAPPAPQPAAQPAPGPAKSTPIWPFVVGGVLLAMVALVLVLVLWKRSGAFVVASRAWERTIAVERLGPVRDSAWCDALPAGARTVGRHSEQRSTRKIPDGQTCTKHKKDNGDGTYREVTDCQPKYREEPVMSDRCDYEVDRWKEARTLRAEGSATDEPRWPSTADLRRGSCIGCEREGARKETYTVVLKDSSSGKTDTCELADPAKWSTFKEGARYEGKKRAMTGSVDCDTLIAK